MSTTGAIFALLAVALIGGVVWYERSKPPAQIVALVAALAALAAAGRVALSPIPNVVPTTDITLIAGFALGGAPGFAVGAVAALASNFWLGQGPWTPWQMAGWGMTGLLGAGLALLTGRRLSRVGLAVACGLAGFAYGALLDLSLMVTYGGEQSLDRYLALSARGLPFNIAHAAGNVAFALIAGPALVRMLGRYRTRFEFAWAKRAAPAGAVSVLLLVVVVAGAVTASPPRAAGSPTSEAVAYLRAAQNQDGGFGFSPDAASSTAMTGWATLGLEAAGVDPSTLSRGGKTPLSYLRSTVGDLEDAAALERTILVVDAAGLDPRRFAGRNLVRKLLKQRGSNGSWGGQVNPTAFGVLALTAAGAGGADRSASWLVSNRNADGGWGFAPGTNSDADTTGAVLQALAAAGSGSGAVRDGVGYLRSVQVAGGGFPLSGGAANAQSTAWAIQGLLAAGVPPANVRKGGRDPFDYLASLQASDGHYRYSRSSDQTPVWVTAQALQAAQRAPFPLARVGGGDSASGGSGASAAGGSGVSSGTGAGAAGGGGGAAAGGGAGAAAGDAAAATPGTAAPEAVAGEPTRFETDTGDDDSGLLIAGVVLGLAVIAGCGYMLNRQATHERAMSRAACPGDLRFAAVDVETAIRTRRTHKAYAPEQVDRAELEQILDLARWAPNHNLTNPWRFRVIGPQALERLKDAAGPESASKLDRAPTLVVCSCVLGGDPVQDEEDLHASACAAYIVLLAAHARGLAGYWRTPEVLRTPEGREAVGLPDEERFVGLLHLGKGVQEQSAPERAPAEQVVEFLPSDLEHRPSLDWAA